MKSMCKLPRWSGVATNEAPDSDLAVRAGRKRCGPVGSSMLLAALLMLAAGASEANALLDRLGNWSQSKICRLEEVPGGETKPSPRTRDHRYALYLRCESLGGSDAYIRQSCCEHLTPEDSAALAVCPDRPPEVIVPLRHAFREAVKCTGPRGSTGTEGFARNPDRGLADRPGVVAAPAHLAALSVLAKLSHSEICQLEGIPRAPSGFPEPSDDQRPITYFRCLAMDGKDGVIAEGASCCLHLGEANAKRLGVCPDTPAGHSHALASALRQALQCAPIDFKRARRSK